MSTDALPPLSVDGRLDRVRSASADAGLDALWVTSPADIRWISGFTGSNGQLVVTADGAALLTDSRYEIQAARQLELADASGIEILIVAADELDRLGERLGDGPIGVDVDHLTVGRRDRLAGHVERELEFRDADRLVAGLREVKDRAEIARLQLAAAVADEALARTLPLIREGRTEQQVAAHFEYQVKLLGADGPAFDTIVASGPNSWLPHATPTRRAIEPGDLVVVDCGARIEGYGSDMTRTIVPGGAPRASQVEQYEAVQVSQQAGVGAVRAGVEARAVDAACRDALAGEGFPDAYRHGSGHGIGLEIHEQPILSPRATASLRDGMVITVEPGAYLAGRGGIRIEDSVIVTESGAEPITHSPTGLHPWA